MTVDPEGRRGNAFDYGAGFVSPTRVLDPGLIYDASPADYKAFLCSIGYNEKSLRLITRDKSTCQEQTFVSPSDLNYPSIAVPNLNNTYTVTRTLTNVGYAKNIYRAVVYPPRGINVTVEPSRIVFDRYGQKISFRVKFQVAAPPQGYVFGFLTWRNRKSRVTMPLVAQVTPSTVGRLI